MEAAMARFTLIERQGTGVRIPDLMTNPPNDPGDPLILVDRVLEDKNGNQRGTFVFRGVIVKRLAADDLVVAFDATNTFEKGVLNAQGVVRFNDFRLPNGVTWAIVGGTGKYRRFAAR
jgi:hypothetical protein